ncbi:MAG: modification methylase [Ignavibacteriales bacterium]|jgi:16S rRNA G966 N2-methylase RsmD|nr:modification methylase [Ignavibacteriales bacterium]
MKYKVIRNEKYDFIGQSYATSYPNLHKYPATMIPQIGIELFKEFDIKSGKLLDPYCGSGTSFTVGLDRGLKEMYGFDINPLAVLISRAKFTKVDIEKVKVIKQRLRNRVYEFVKIEQNLKEIKIPDYYNIDFWFSKVVLQNLAVLKFFIDKIQVDIRRLFLVPFSETIRECSYTRNNEFKLYRIKPEELLNFNPDVFGVYFDKLNKVIDIYEKYYLPKINDAKVDISYSKFPKKVNEFDIVLTSPPYGDSFTTVAYGQFSMFSNQWFGIKYARQIDNMLMGGSIVKEIYQNSIITEFIHEISKQSKRRALEVSSFYFDLDKSIKDVAHSVKKKGIVIYIVGNRRVKDIQLPTDQFVAEKFEGYGFKHILTYERLLGNKAMPLQNSPSNKAGLRKGTMTKEYIVVCEK